MTERIRTDICVIGGGAGGLSVAAAAAAFGVPVVLVEKGPMGGECLNAGCVPSKALIASARRARIAAESGPFGIRAAPVQVDFEAVHAHVRGVIAAIAPNDSRQRFTGLGVQVIEGAATFKNKKAVVVDDTEIRARRFVIATGSSPAVPPIPGLESTSYLTNETIFDLTICPEHLIVIGAGPTGLELGQAFRRLGAAVTVLEAAIPLVREDPECARIVLDQLAREGVTVRPRASIARVETEGSRIAVTLSGASGEQRVVGSHLLVATGRRPNVEGLNLESARIAYSPTGIVVDRRLRTGNRRVYAIGDVTGGPQFTHAASYHASLVIRDALFRQSVRVDASLIPRVIFTDPELAQVGLTEDEARRAGHVIRVLRWPVRENDRAQAERETRGHIKVVTDGKGRILGATIVGAGAGELITTWGLALSQRLNIRALASLVVPYPTLAEAGKRAAITYFLPRLTSGIVRRIIGLLRRFG